jgi:hypothetical protein
MTEEKTAPLVDSPRAGVTTPAGTHETKKKPPGKAPPKIPCIDTLRSQSSLAKSADQQGLMEPSHEMLLRACILLGQRVHRCPLPDATIKPASDAGWPRVTKALPCRMRPSSAFRRRLAKSYQGRAGKNIANRFRVNATRLPLIARSRVLP